MDSTSIPLNWGPGALIKSGIAALAAKAREQNRLREAGKLPPITLRDYIIPPEHRSRALQEQPDGQKDVT